MESSRFISRYRRRTIELSPPPVQTASLPHTSATRQFPVNPPLVTIEVGLRLAPSALGDFSAELEPADVAVGDMDAAEEPRHARLFGGPREALPRERHGRAR